MDIPSLKRLGRSPLSILFSPSFLVFAGGMARSGFGFIISLMIARYFGVEDYGLFYTYMVISVLSLAVAGDALDGGVVRFFTYRLHHDPKRAHDVLGSALAFRVIVAVLLIVLSGLFVLVLAPHTMAAQDYGHLVMAGVLGGAFVSLVSFSNSIFISRENFFYRAALLPSLNAARCLVLGLCLLGGLSGLITILWIDVAVMITFALMTLWLVRTDLAAIGFCRETMRDLFQYAKWSIAGMASYLLFMGLNAPLLIYFWGEGEAGIYGAAISFAMIVEHAAGAIVTVQWQRASKIRTAQEIRQFLRRTALVSLLCAAALAPLGLIGGPVIELAFGSAFSTSAAIFPIIFIGTIIHMISMPLALIFIATDKPHRIAYAAMLGLVSWAAAAAILIPAYAEWGAALSVLVARIAQGVAIAVMVGRALATTGTEDEVSGGGAVR